MRVLVACEYSGIVRSAFRSRGHDAWSNDILPAADGSPFHYQCDAREALLLDWDLVIAHPPCTRLNNAGVRWLRPRNLWEPMREGAAFFNHFKGCAPRVCIENPVMHGYAAEICGPPTMSFQPWEFGEPQFKRTCLWLENLPLLRKGPIRTDVPNRKAEPERHAAWSKVHRASPGKDRGKIRSLFFESVAAAMAEQWGSLELLD